MNYKGESLHTNEKSDPVERAREEEEDSSNKTEKNKKRKIREDDSPRECLSSKEEDDEFWVKKLSPDSILPERSYDSAGYDLFSSEDFCVPVNGKAKIKTGICVQFPKKYVGKIESRSSYVWDHSLITVAGVIDSDYRGEVNVIMLNNGKEDYNGKKGSKIAQLLLQRVALIPIVEKNELSPSQRGEKGFGSSTSFAKINPEFPDL
jgi:dUTP pyrophosphatase